VRGNLSAGPAALGLYMAAIRETFEEAGLLPALRADGGGIDPDGADASLFRDKRRLVHDGRMDLAELARTENLVYDLSGLIPWARWITPRVEPKRFDAWFFLALAPPGQTPASDQVEMREALWMRPADAAAEHEAGTIFMMPPTLMILLELAELGSVERMFASGPDRDLRPVLPQAVDDAGRLVLLLPHDPEYSIDGYRQEVRPGRPSRLTLDGGVWRVGRAS
jgi:8-oxo-dGTP pyrophosphatase MutT (NUDIX family)